MKNWMKLLAIVAFTWLLWAMTSGSRHGYDAAEQRQQRDYAREFEHRTDLEQLQDRTVEELK
jgi:hypothetical protein